MAIVFHDDIIGGVDNPCRDGQRLAAGESCNIRCDSATSLPGAATISCPVGSSMGGPTSPPNGWLRCVPLPIPCDFTFSAWGSCNEDCDGTQTRTYTVNSLPAYGGTPCPAVPVTERQCSRLSEAACGVVDCNFEWTQWTPWTQWT